LKIEQKVGITETKSGDTRRVDMKDLQNRMVSNLSFTVERA